MIASAARKHHVLFQLLATYSRSPSLQADFHTPTTKLFLFTCALLKVGSIPKSKLNNAEDRKMEQRASSAGDTRWNAAQIASFQPPGTSTKIYDKICITDVKWWIIRYIAAMRNMCRVRRFGEALNIWYWNSFESCKLYAGDERERGTMTRKMHSRRGREAHESDEIARDTSRPRMEDVKLMTRALRSFAVALDCS